MSLKLKIEELLTEIAADKVEEKAIRKIRAERLAMLDRLDLERCRQLLDKPNLEMLRRDVLPKIQSQSDALMFAKNYDIETLLSLPLSIQGLCEFVDELRTLLSRFNVPLATDAGRLLSPYLSKKRSDEAQLNLEM